jgi:exopolyphosphatase/guanosine-5'-triphosphate,3'-diphosphate pyrophosphatase
MRRVGVLDVGCHSALLSVGRERPGAALEPRVPHKVRLRLHQALDRDGRLRASGIESVQRAVAETAEAGRRHGLARVFTFATSVIRDAPNRDEVIGRVAGATGIRLKVLAGEEEARLSYEAAARWASATGPLLVLDIGGGTLELAWGTGARAGFAYSLPLGARTITHTLLPGGTVASQRHLAEVRNRIRRSLRAAPPLPRAVHGVRALACSKTFRQLARLTDALDGHDGATRGRQLVLPRLTRVIPLLADTDPADRSGLPGISRHRAEQSLAGALVAEALMERYGVESVDICPWATREGLMLRLLDGPSGRATDGPGKPRPVVRTAPRSLPHATPPRPPVPASARAAGF